MLAFLDTVDSIVRESERMISLRASTQDDLLTDGIVACMGVHREAYRDISVCSHR